jgi:hypothetical protein
MVGILAAIFNMIVKTHIFVEIVALWNFEVFCPISNIS